MNGKLDMLKIGCMVVFGGLWLMAWTQTVSESAVLQGSILGLVLFNNFINDQQRGDSAYSHQVCR